MCIDKTISAELSEAINSIYDRYSLSETCYGFLEDIAPATVEECNWAGGRVPREPVVHEGLDAAGTHCAT